MSIEVVPALRAQRDLLELPRGMERFDAYVATMIDEAENVVLPLVTFNPMSREHVAEVLDDLLVMGAERVVSDAASEADRRLGAIERKMRLFVVVADDAEGGWTHRSITDYEFRFTKKSMFGDGWVQILEWSSEGADIDRVRRDTLAQIYRTLYIDRFGLPRTLGEMMRQEGLAAAFAGSPEGDLDTEDVAYTREAVEPYLPSTDRGVHFACLFGDEAAESAGYERLGFSPWAGFAAGYANAREGEAPESLLSGQGVQS